jgi:O-antigen ligase
LGVLDSADLTFFTTLKRYFPFALLAAYGIFLCSYFLFEDYSDPYRFFARVVFVLGIFYFVPNIREIWRHPLFLAVAVYTLYLLLSGFWSDPRDWYRFGQMLTISVYLLAFIAITRFLIRWNRALYRRMLQLCVLVAAIAALASIVDYTHALEFPGARLDGIGSLTNSNEFSNVYGVFALLAMGFALQSKALAHKLALLGAVGIFICFVWLGQSRTAFSSLIVTLLILVSLAVKERSVLYAGSLAALTGALVLVFPDVIEQALLRGLGLRPQIWGQAWAQALASPLIGHGLVSPISIHVGGEHFETIHNAFLQVFWQGGVIGLGLFLGLLAVLFRHAWLVARRENNFTIFAILLFATCVMLTGVDTLIARPRDQWMLFWFPVALLLSCYGDLPRRLPRESA